MPTRLQKASQRQERVKPSELALAQPLRKRLPASDWHIQRYHAIGGANSTTMVVMFVG